LGTTTRSEGEIVKLSMIHWMRSEPIEETIARLARTGWDGIEINGEPALYDADLVRSCLEEHGLVAWGAVTLMDYGRDMVHPDRYVRIGTQAYLHETIDLIAALGGTVLCCVPVTIGKLTSLASPSVEWNWCREGLRTAGEYAGERGVRIALEPITRFETYLLNRAEQALAMVEDVDLPNVGVCLDTFHMNIEETAPLDAIREAGPRLFDFHVADNNRKPPGQGTLDWPSILRTLQEVGYAGHLSAEVEPPRDRSRLATVPEQDGQYTSDFYEDLVAATPKYLRSLKPGE
jgi:sugar phosphate isomerase/epimerase